MYSFDAVRTLPSADTRWLIEAKQGHNKTVNSFVSKARNYVASLFDFGGAAPAYALA